MDILKKHPTTRDLPKTQTEEQQKYRIGFGIDGNGRVGFALWKDGFAIGPIYTGSLEEPDLALASLTQAILYSKKESK